jgi:hypothetical protein
MDPMVVSAVETIRMIREKTLPATAEDFDKYCFRIAKALEGRLGDELRIVSFSALGASDVGQVTISSRTNSGDLIISAEGIVYFSVEKPMEIEGSFVDQFIVKPLVVGPGRYPDELEGRLPVALSGVEKLVWVKIIGPTLINLVACSLAIATTLQN